MPVPIPVPVPVPDANPRTLRHVEEEERGYVLGNGDAPLSGESPGTGTGTGRGRQRHSTTTSRGSGTHCRVGLRYHPTMTPQPHALFWAFDLSEPSFPSGEIPEPMTLAGALAGLAALGGYLRRRR